MLGRGKITQRLLEQEQERRPIGRFVIHILKAVTYIYSHFLTHPLHSKAPFNISQFLRARVCQQTAQAGPPPLVKPGGIGRGAVVQNVQRKFHISPHFTKFHHISPNFTKLHHISPHFTTFHHISPHFTTFHHIS